MQNFQHKGDAKTPTISLDATSGKFEFSGRSIPEHPIEFYKPVYDWLDEYTKSPNPKTEASFKLEYFNTSSSKVLYDILRKLEKVKGAGAEVLVKWYFESDDPDMEEVGKDFKALLKIPVELVSIEEFEFKFI